MVKEGKGNCFQVLRGSHGQADHETAINIQATMIVTVTNSTAHPSAAAVSSGNVPDDSSNSASLVAMAALTATFVVLVISLLGYRRFRRTSGAVWISKLASFRGRYRTMGDEDQSAQDGFILGFNNPVADSSVGSSGDTIDGKVTVLGYRPLGEDSDGYKGYSLFKSMFPRDRLAFGSILGTGWCGKVYEGDAYRIKPGWRRTKVVIKELRRNSNSQLKEIFLNETDVLRRVEHKNLLTVLGQATEQEPYLIILEHTPVGDLKKFLLERQCDKKWEGVPLPLRMSIDIASGLHCLHANFFYHSDLAARNCLVFPDLSVKIGDYGISRCIYESDYYNRPNAPNTIPVRWLPPEGVVTQEDGFLVTTPPSSQGNVWSFGVTLWEIVECGKQPYKQLSNEDVLQSVIEDRLYQLPEPRNRGDVMDSMYGLMLQCWVEPDRRPSLQKLESTLMSLMSSRTVPCLTTSITKLKRETDLHESQATSDMKPTSHPIAVVRPLRLHSTEPSTEPQDDVKNSTHESSDVEATVIASESPPPVTYIGNPSEELKETLGTPEPPSAEGTSKDCQPSVIVEPVNAVFPEYVMMPGEVIRRRGSILKNPEAPSKPAKVVHFPVNILALRTVHKYERMDSFEEDNFIVDGKDSREDSDESGEDIGNSPVVKDGLYSTSAEGNGNIVLNGLPSPESPVEKKIRKGARRKKLEECSREWVVAIDSNTENAA